MAHCEQRNVHSNWDERNGLSKSYQGLGREEGVGEEKREGGREPKDRVVEDGCSSLKTLTMLYAK